MNDLHWQVARLGVLFLFNMVHFYGMMGLRIKLVGSLKPSQNIADLGANERFSVTDGDSCIDSSTE